MKIKEYMFEEELILSVFKIEQVVIITQIDLKEKITISVLYHTYSSNGDLIRKVL